MSEFGIPEETMLSSQANHNDIIKINTFSIRKTLVFIAYIDLFIQIINGFTLVTATNTDNSSYNVSDLHIYGYISFGCAALILIGVCGINRYHRYISYGYGIYLILNILSRLSLIFFFNISPFTFVFSFLILIVNIWLLKLLFKFTSNIKNLSDDDLNELRQGWKPTVVYRVIYY